MDLAVLIGIVVVLGYCMSQAIVLALHLVPCSCCCTVQLSKSLCARVSYLIKNYVVISSPRNAQGTIVRLTLSNEDCT
jgi:hypothetical protein